MSEKLKLIARITNETGLWFAAIGFLISMTGVALAFIALPSLGYWIGVAGALLAFVGIAMHFVMNWREIFHVNK
jgi:hypothetical protein